MLSSSVSRVCLLRPRAHSGRTMMTRLFMSPSFQLENEWAGRLSSPVFRQIEMNKFFVDIDRKFQREQRGSHVDVDLFANKAQTETELEQLEEVMHQFRRCPQTYLTSPSTQFAVVRGFSNQGWTDNLMRMLDDRLNYGLFPDDYSLTYLLNYFLQRENWRDAAKVGIHMMIQEDLAIPIARDMAVYGCYMYVKYPAVDQLWEPQAVPGEPEPEEDVKVRVKYLESDYFDDHFDLDQKEHLVGKTLVEMSQGDPDLKLVGLTLWAKWDLLREHIAQGQFALEAVNLLKEYLSGLEQLENKDSLLALLEMAKTTETDLEGRLKSNITESVTKHEGTYVEAQKELFQKWNLKREMDLEKQYQTYQREAKKEEILRKKNELQEEEERLFFFQNKDDLDTKKEAKEKAWRQSFPSRTWGKVTLKPRHVVSEDYTPPEIGQKKD